MHAFDGYPYAVTYVVPAFFHITLLPADVTRERLEQLTSRQAAVNQLPTCLVLGPDDCIYYSEDDGGVSSTSAPVPTATWWTAFRVVPVELFPETEELSDRRARLVKFIALTTPHGIIGGDPAKAGRPAQPEDLARLGGHDENGIRRGLDRCMQCGAYRGECLDATPLAAELVVQVHCRCVANNRCAGCGDLLAEWKLNANHYDESADIVWHLGAIAALNHQCRVLPDGTPDPDDTDMSRTARGFSIDVQRMVDVAQSERNFTPAFHASIHTSEDFLRVIAEDWQRYSHLDFLDEGNWYEIDDGVTHDAFAVFTFLDLEVLPIVSLEWDGFGPCSSGVQYCALRNLGGFDFVYRWDETSGYPIAAVQPTGIESLEHLARRVMYDEFLGVELQSLPSRILNSGEDVLSPLWFRQTIYDALERHSRYPDSYAAPTGWNELRDSIVNDLLYPDHLRKSMAVLEEAVLGPVREDEFDVDEDESGEITEKEKWALVDTYLTKAYWTTQAFHQRLDAGIGKLREDTPDNHDEGNER
jgi:hypothetical protein